AKVPLARDNETWLRSSGGSFTPEPPTPSSNAPPDPPTSAGTPPVPSVSPPEPGEPPARSSPVAPPTAPGGLPKAPPAVAVEPPDCTLSSLACESLEPPVEHATVNENPVTASADLTFEIGTIEKAGGGVELYKGTCACLKTNVLRVAVYILTAELGSRSPRGLRWGERASFSPPRREHSAESQRLYSFPSELTSKTSPAMAPPERSRLSDYYKDHSDR